jgi:spore coat polysaccharide biosynthesis protein SpsF
MSEQIMNKKIDVIVEVRMGSTRLPEKVLLPAAGKPLLQHMIERLHKIPEASSIIMATTLNKADDCLVGLAEQWGVDCYRGDEDDVLGRVIGTAEYFGTDIIVEITGDNPLVDPDLSSQVIRAYLEHEYDIDYAANDAGPTYPVGTFPIGVNTRVFSTAFLKSIGELTDDPVDREHVVNYVMKRMDQFKILNLSAEGAFSRNDLRWTLDTPSDYHLIKAVFDQLYPANPDFRTLDIIEFMDANPEIRDLNKSVVQQTYQYE